MEQSPEQMRQNYLIEMGEIVTDAFVSASRPISAAEIRETAEVWTEHLFKIVPAIRLRDCLEVANHQHDSPFPVNAHELRNAYRVIYDEETKRARLEREAAADREFAAYNSPFYEPCEFCFGCGFRIEFRRIEGVDTRGAAKCYGCDYWQRFKEKHNL